MPARMSGDSTVPPAEPGGPRDDGPVRIAEHDPGAHADQLVDEEEPRLEHLLEDQHHPLALGGGHHGDRHRVGREGRPGAVLELGHVAAEVGADPAFLLGIDDQRGAVEPRPDAEALEAEQRAAQVVGADAFDRELRRW